MAKTLNPMATPYHKQSHPLPNPHHEICIYKTLQPQPPFLTPYLNFQFHHHHHHHPYTVHQPIYAVNIPQRKQPQLYLLPPPPPSPPSPPSPSPVKKQTKIFANFEIPAGPRVSKFRLSGRHRKIVKAAGRYDTKVDCGGGKNFVWSPKSTQGIKKHKNVGQKKRWKNQSGDYFQMLPMDDDTTSVMIKNVPNRYTRQLMIQTLDNYCKSENSKMNDGHGCFNDKNSFVSAYDFLYLPIDFNKRLNAGFAFVNFTTPKAALRFRDSFHGKHWGVFGSRKVAEIFKARIQGKEGLFRNCKTMNFEFGADEDKPVIFEPARDGSGRVISKMQTLGQSLQALRI